MSLGWRPANRLDKADAWIVEVGRNRQLVRHREVQTLLLRAVAQRWCRRRAGRSSLALSSQDVCRGPGVARLVAGDQSRATARRVCCLFICPTSVRRLRPGCGPKTLTLPVPARLRCFPTKQKTPGCGGSARQLVALADNDRRGGGSLKHRIHPDTPRDVCRTGVHIVNTTLAGRPRDGRGRDWRGRRFVGSVTSAVSGRAQSPSPRLRVQPPLSSPTPRRVSSRGDVEWATTRRRVAGVGHSTSLMGHETELPGRELPGRRRVRRRRGRWLVEPLPSIDSRMMSACPA